MGTLYTEDTLNIKNTKSIKFTFSSLIINLLTSTT